MVPTVFILTRFAIRPDSELDHFSGATGRPLWRSPSWFEKRLPVFQRFTVPSVKNQSDQDFQWLIGVDDSIDSALIDKLADAAKGVGTVVRVATDTTFDEEIGRQLRNRSGPYVTMRLDSDDALANGFVARLKKICRRPNYVYNFPHGVAYFWDRKILVHKWTKSNPFIALFSETPTHVLELGLHSKVDKFFHVREVKTALPMYMKSFSADMTSAVPTTGFPVSRAALRLFKSSFSPSLTKLPLSNPKERISLAFSFIGKTLGQRYPLVSKIWKFYKNVASRSTGQGRNLK